MPNREQKLQNAVNRLAKFYGLYSAKSLSARLALESTPSRTGGPATTSNTTAQQNPSTSGRSDVAMAQLSGVGSATSENLPINDNVIQAVIENFIDTSEGAYTTAELSNIFKQLIGGTDVPQDVKNRFKQLFEVYADNDAVKAADADAGTEPLFHPERNRNVTINGLLGYGSGQGGIVNGAPNNPNKEQPGVSILFSNSKRVAQTGRHANACTIFLNGIPNLEIAKALPYLDVRFLFARPPVNDSNKRLQTPGILKFLYGAAEVNTTHGGSGSIDPLKVMALGSTTTLQSQNGREISNDVYTVAGMEVFTSPQTLVNADETDDENLRSNPVLDKFRPFLTLKEFEVDIHGTTGLANYKTARLTFVLHDRSRMADIADMIRPDLYGRTELLVEYGWIHPDGEQQNVDNVYGDLINGMRCREKYGIRNSSFTFDDSNQVNVVLELFMKGGTDLSTEVISSDDESVGNAIREIQELQELITDLRQRVFQIQGVRTREVRGIQILDAAQDAMAYSILSSDVKDELRQFRQALRDSSSPNVTSLRTALDNLFGEESRSRNPASRRSGGSAAGGALGRLRATVLESISRKVAKMTGNDPFLIPDYPATTGRSTGEGRQIATAPQNQRQSQNRAQQQYEQNFGTSVTTAKTSLATLLLHFVAEPLANTKKYDDIQLIFYPFNGYAGFASNLNIGNFEVDMNFFTQEFSRQRLNNINRSSNMNLREFMSFVGQAIVDDPAARSYGLWDTDGALYRDVYDTNGQVRSTEAVSEVPRLQQRMEGILRGITPDGTFRMPQVEFYVECLPGKVAPQDGVSVNSVDNKSILRIHVYDRQASAYESLGTLLGSSRDGELEAVGRIPGGTPGNTAVSANAKDDASAFIAAGQAFGLIEKVEHSDPVMYRIVGGPRKLKEFLYRTVPYIIYGAGGSLVKQVNLSSQQNPELSTINMLRTFRRSELQPNGELPGGLPMRIIPTELSMETFGCPLLVYTQQFFVDFQTGTSADNIYGITGISHRISDGQFTTSLKFAPFDAYGRYDSFMNRIFNASRVLQDIENRSPQAEGTQRTPSTAQTRTDSQG